MCSVLNILVIVVVFSVTSLLGTNATFNGQQQDANCAVDSCVLRENQNERDRIEYSMNLVADKATVNKSANSSVNSDSERFVNNGVWLNVAGDQHEEDLLSKLNSRILAISAPFDAGVSSKSSQQCKLHTNVWQTALKNFDLWALKMYDASAKISSGILNGNVNHFGDFDQCLGAQEPDAAFSGQYCLAYLQPSISDDLTRHKQMYKLMMSHGAFTSEFDDPGHRVPRFSMINWALCVPSTCSPMDVQHSLQDYIQNLTAGTGVKFQIRIDPDMCQTKSDKPYDRNTKIAASFFLTVIVISILSTIVDYKVDKPNPWLVAFSLRKNVKAMFNTRRDPSDIGSIHGIRFFNAFMLILAHKSMALFFDPYVNRTEMTESLGQHWTVLGRAAAIYTDAFLMFSGLLTSYSIIGRLRRNQPTRLMQDYIGRFLRIVPLFGALILFCTYILPNLGSGPQWNLVVTHHADICKDHWWRNLLFIHNYFGFENMCLTHTHHLGIDTQLFVVAPPLVLLLWKWPKRGAMFLFALAGISTILRFQVTVTHKLSNYVYFGSSIERMFKTADLMYTQPIYRATIYILGILLGYALRTYKDIRLTGNQLRVGWYVSSVLFLLAFFGPAPMGSINYVYNEYHAAIYAALGPMAWCGIFAWIVFTSHLGYNSLLSKFLSWRGFLVTTRLSYAIYLTQFPAFFYNVGRTRHAGYYSFISDTINVHELSSIAIASIVLTIFFDTPFQNIKKIIFKPNAKADSQLTATQNGISDKEISYDQKSVVKNLNE